MEKWCTALSQDLPTIVFCATNSIHWTTIKTWSHGWHSKKKPSQVSSALKVCLRGHSVMFTMWTHSFTFTLSSPSQCHSFAFLESPSLAFLLAASLLVLCLERDAQKLWPTRALKGRKRSQNNQVTHSTHQNVTGFTFSHSYDWKKWVKVIRIGVWSSNEIIVAHSCTDLHICIWEMPTLRGLQWWKACQLVTLLLYRAES